MSTRVDANILFDEMFDRLKFADDKENQKAR